MKITIISSSTRRGRISHRIALALEKMMSSKDIQTSIIDLNEERLPIFEERYTEREDRPENWDNIMSKLQESDGLIFLTPEYNGTITSSLKNFIDVFAKGGFAKKPIGVATGSTGAMGGIRAAYQLQQIILSLGAFPHPRMLTVGKMNQVINPDGVIGDERTQSTFENFVDLFADFTKRLMS